MTTITHTERTASVLNARRHEKLHIIVSAEPRVVSVHKNSITLEATTPVHYEILIDDRHSVETPHLH